VHEPVWVVVAALLGFNVGLVIGLWWEGRRQLSSVVKGLNVLNTRLAIIERRQDTWIHRSPTEKMPADPTFAESEIATKREPRR
jgi:hypothetical protein